MTSIEVWGVTTPGPGSLLVAANCWVGQAYGTVVVILWSSTMAWQPAKLSDSLGSENLCYSSAVLLGQHTSVCAVPILLVHG